MACQGCLMMTSCFLSALVFTFAFLFSFSILVLLGLSLVSIAEYVFGLPSSVPGFFISTSFVCSLVECHFFVLLDPWFCSCGYDDVFARVLVGSSKRLCKRESWGTSVCSPGLLRSHHL